MSDRMTTFAEEIGQLESATSGSGRERPLQLLGAVLMVVGIAIALGAYVAAGNQNSGDLALDNLEHNELVILALAGVATSVTGGAVFLRYSLGRFMRLWLLRQLHEGRRQREALDQARSS